MGVRMEKEHTIKLLNAINEYYSIASELKDLKIEIDFEFLTDKMVESCAIFLCDEKLDDTNFEFMIDQVNWWIELSEKKEIVEKDSKVYVKDAKSFVNYFFGYFN
jgi:hypothetical protein